MDGEQESLMIAVRAEVQACLELHHLRPPPRFQSGVYFEDEVCVPGSLGDCQPIGQCRHSKKATLVGLEERNGHNEMFSILFLQLSFC
jgi:hypothetical protein